MSLLVKQNNSFQNSAAFGGLKQLSAYSCFVDAASQAASKAQTHIFDILIPMALIYITGPTGSGKSTVYSELRRLGYEAHDTDDEGNRFWINKQSGRPVEVFRKSEKKGREWFSKNFVGLSKDWLQQLKNKSKTETIYIFGISENDLDFFDLYDQVILLNIDENTQKERIVRRASSNYGKEPKQLSAAQKWRPVQIEKYRDAGAKEIDATLPLQEVVNKVLAISALKP